MAHYPLNHHSRHAYRFLAGAAGLYLLLCGVLGLAQTWGEPFFGRGSHWVLGLRVNPASSWLLLLAGLVILAAAVLGGNVHHRINLVLGWGVLGFAVFEMAVLRTDANVFNASMTNVIALLICGLVVLTAALYGKVGTPDEVRAEAEAPHAARS
jgi:hypothetical protein